MNLVLHYQRLTQRYFAWVPIPFHSTRAKVWFLYLVPHVKIQVALDLSANQVLAFEGLLKDKTLWESTWEI